MNASSSSTLELEYRESIYGDVYRIRFEKNAALLWKIYALAYPRDPHNESVRINHKYPDNSICVTIQLDSLSKAKAVATHWMMGWSKYVRSTSGTWPQQNGNVRIRVPD